SPPVGMSEKDDEGDRDEERAAKHRALEPAEPQPQAECEECQRHRKREIGEAEQEWISVDEGEREEGGRRNSPVHLSSDPQETGRGQRRDREHDQLYRQLKPKQFAERNDQEIDPEVADRGPVIIVISLEER